MLDMVLKMEWLKIFNEDYASAVSALTPFVIGVVSWFYYGVYKESQSKNQGQIYVSPSFWSLRERHRIDTLKRLKLTDDRKNYEEIETLYTPESWGQYIDIRRCLFKTTIVPKHKNEIIVLTLKRTPYENWKIIYFNR